MSVRRVIDTGAPEPPPPSESDLLRLSSLSQRRSFEETAAYLGSIAEQAQRSMVSLPELGATGVMWPGGLVVTAGWHNAIKDAEISGPQIPIAALRRGQGGAETAVLRTETGLHVGVAAAGIRGAWVSGRAAARRMVAARHRERRDADSAGRIDPALRRCRTLDRPVGAGRQPRGRRHHGSVSNGLSSNTSDSPCWRKPAWLSV